MDCNQRGVALVSVVLFLTVLFILAHILCEKVWQSTQQRAAAASREQTFWAAQAGLEAARLRLAASYASSSGWQSFLTAETLSLYPETPAWTLEINAMPVEIFVRDNPDGDGDVQSDNDLKIFVLARARSRQGFEAMVEGLCGFVMPVGGAGRHVVSAGVSLSEQPVNTYGITD